MSYTKIYKAAHKAFCSSRKAVLLTSLMLVVCHLFPLGVLRITSIEIPWYAKEVTYTILFMLRCCMFCYIGDLVNGVTGANAFRCFTWKRAYITSLSIAISYQRIIIPLYQLIAYSIFPAENKIARVLLMMFAYTNYSLITYFFDSYLAKLILSDGKIHIREIIKGWMPMLLNRIKIELRLSIMLVIPLVLTFAALYAVHDTATGEQFNRILFFGQTVYWGVGFYFIPMQMISRFLHTALNYYQEGVPVN